MIKKVEQDRQKCLFASVTMFKLYVSGPSEPEGPGGRGAGTPNFIPRKNLNLLSSYTIIGHSKFLD